MKKALRSIKGTKQKIIANIAKSLWTTWCQFFVKGIQIALTTAATLQTDMLYRLAGPMCSVMYTPHQIASQQRSFDGFILFCGWIGFVLVWVCCVIVGLGYLYTTYRVLGGADPFGLKSELLKAAGKHEIAEGAECG